MVGALKVVVADPAFWINFDSFLLNLNLILDQSTLAESHLKVNISISVVGISLDCLSEPIHSLFWLS
jgi:hypothetical protein